MPWLRIDDEFFENDKVAPLSDRAFRFHVAALCYCARKLTDGRMDGKAIRMVGVALEVAPKARVTELVAAGLWLEQGDAYTIKDYLDYNPSKEDVLRERARSAARQREHKARAKAARNAVDDMLANDVSNGVTNAAGNAGPHPQPVPKEQSSNSQGFLRDVGTNARAFGSTFDQIVAECERVDAEARKKLERTRRANHVPESRLVDVLFAIRHPDTRDPVAKALSMFKKATA